MKKMTSILLAVMLIFTVTGATTFAADTDEAQQPVEAETYYCPTIPEPMQPGTVIEYVDDSTIKIIEGGFQSENFTEALSAPGIYSNPVAGLVVDYADDGLIVNFDYPEGVADPLMAGHDDPIPFASEVVPAPNDSMTDAISWVLIQQWGAYPNKLYRDANNASARRGSGRVIAFDDPVGQVNIPNFKGSVATKLAYDNCPINTKIDVRLYPKGGASTSRKVVMTKTDARGLPNAILAIWKTGVEFWDYTYSSDWSADGCIYTYN